ncbi:MAG: hypothetical protein IT330_13330 [Anaerolineae bacterium]|nr:hypothetical protein [Anaerolineae bacterium]
MKKLIEIHCPSWRLEQNEGNRQRLQACIRRQPTDRPPAIVSLHLRYLLWARGEKPGDYFENPRTQLEQQILNYKWIVENLYDDRGLDFKRVTVSPDFDTLRGTNFPVGVRMSPDGSVVAEPFLQKAEEIERLEVPDVTANHNGKKVTWFHAMKEMAAEYEVTLNGAPLEVHVGLGAFSGPFPEAYAVAGTNIFLWMYDAPHLVHRLMRTVTAAFLNWQRYVRDLTGAPAKDLFMGADAAEMLKPHLFREFVLPYYRECYETFPGERGLHMCGKIDHLLPLLADEMKITQLTGFGAVTNPVLLAEWLGGKAYMTGGPDPILLWKGSPEEIRKDCFRYLNILAPHGGYVLQDGHGLAPGTSLENLHTLVQAAREYVNQNQRRNPLSPL